MNAILVASNNLNLKLWGGIPNNTVIERNLGNRNICLYFDFRPITYVAPPLYTIVVMLAAGKINFSDMDKLLLRNQFSYMILKHSVSIVINSSPQFFCFSLCLRSKYSSEDSVVRRGNNRSPEEFLLFLPRFLLVWYNNVYSLFCCSAFGSRITDGAHLAIYYSDYCHGFQSGLVPSHVFQIIVKGGTNSLFNLYQQIAVVWFGDLSSLKTDGDNISGESKYFVPDWSRILGKVALAIQIVVSLGKVTFQVIFYKFTKVVQVKYMF